MRWWGWGEDGHAVPLPPAAEGAAARRARRRPGGTQAAGRRSSRSPVPDPRAARARARAPGRGRGRRARARRPRGRASRTPSGARYPDLVRIRSGDASSAPDAVVLPASAEQVAAVLAACAEQRVAVTPFGGGTSVVGGVEPVRDGHGGGDLARPAPARPTVEVDRTSLTARLDAGLLGPEAERRLGARGRHARPLPAVVRVLDRRRLGGHALGRPGVHGLRAHRRAGGGRALHRPGGRARDARAARVRGRPGRCAS